jgi:hypothetical protein
MTSAFACEEEMVRACRYRWRNSASAPITAFSKNTQEKKVLSLGAG